jgi:glycosyltransferase involved in cell wall biosynthesis
MFSVLINTQTPPLKFKLTYRDIIEKYGYINPPIEVNQLEPSDYTTAVGGVARMMTTLSKRFSNTRWISLSPGYPPEVKFENIHIFFIDLDPEDMQHYSRFKEGIYNESHGLAKYEIEPKDYISYAKYNWLSAQKMLEFYRETDVYLINDFQQLLVGGIIGPSAPAVLWYHIPFVPEYLSRRNRDFLIKAFEAFDAVIVSTKRDLEGLIRAGARTRAKQIYPFIDPLLFKKLNSSDLDKLREKYKINDEEKVITIVARLDPMKSQDTAIMALKKLSNEKLKLLIVGDGSFTSSVLGVSKSSVWAKECGQQFC